MPFDNMTPAFKQMTEPIIRELNMTKEEREARFKKRHNLFHGKGTRKNRKEKK